MLANKLIALQDGFVLWTFQIFTQVVVQFFINFLIISQSFEALLDFFLLGSVVELQKFTKEDLKFFCQFLGKKLFSFFVEGSFFYFFDLNIFEKISQFKDDLFVNIEVTGR